MEANRQAYEDLTEQLGSYISMFSSQMSLSHVTQQPDHVSRSYSTLQHVPRHVSLDQGRTCSLPRSRHHYLDTSVDTSDGDMRHDNSNTERGFLSLPRHQARPRSRHQDRFRNRWGPFLKTNWQTVIIFWRLRGVVIVNILNICNAYPSAKFVVSSVKTLDDDPSPADPGVIVPGVLLKPGEVKKVKETNGFI